MKKLLLSLVSLFILGIGGVQATDNIALSLEDLGSGWSSSYDADTQTITIESGWAGRGWWLGDVDYSNYAGVQVVIKTELTGTINLITQYNYYASYDEEGNGEGDALSTSTSLTSPSGDADEEQTIYCAFDEDMKNSVMQVYIQSASAGDIVVVSATVIANENADDVNTVEDEVLDLTGDNTGNWDSGATRTAINEDGSVDLTFPLEWSSFGWTNWWPMWDVTPYDKIVVTYSNFTPDGTYDEEDPAYLQVYVGGSNASATAQDKDVTGTIELVIADTDLYTSNGEVYNDDYSAIGQIYIQASKPCTVTINSIKFVKNSAESNEEGDYFVSLDFEGDNSAWTLYDGDKIEITTGGPADTEDNYLSVDYGNEAWGVGAYPASTPIIYQTSAKELPAGTYTVSATICVGGECNGLIDLYATNSDGTVYSNASISNSDDYGVASPTSVEVTLTDDDYLTIGITTNASWVDTAYLWLYADNFSVDGTTTEGDATGITSVTAVPAITDGAIYNLAGQRVTEGTKGLLIKNGKKVLVK